MSTTTRTEDPGHAIARFSTRLHQVLDTLTPAPAWSMTPAEQRAVLVDLARAEARLAGLRLRVLAAADRNDIAADSAATSTGAWLAQHTRQTRGAAHAQVTLALALDTGFTVTREALAAGLIDVDQARGDRPLRPGTARHSRGGGPGSGRGAPGPGGSGSSTTGRSRCWAGGSSRSSTPRPPTWPRAAGSRPRRPPRRGRPICSCRRTRTAATPAGSRSRPCTPRCSPRCCTPSPTPSTRHRPQPTSARSVADPPEATGGCRGPSGSVRRSAGSWNGCPGDRLPLTGGMSATVVVLLDYDRLLSGLGTAVLDTGQPISAALARQLACEAGLIPAVWARALGSPVGGPGPRAPDPAAHRAPTHRPDPPRPGLHHPRLRPARRLVSRPPRHPLVRRWPHQRRQRPAALRASTTARPTQRDYDTTHLPTGQIQFHRRT